MKIRTTLVFKTLEGEDTQWEDKPLTFRHAVTETLMALQVNENALPYEEKVLRSELSERILAEDEVEITDEEAALIKRYMNCGVWCGPLIMGQLEKLMPTPKAKTE